MIDHDSMRVVLGEEALSQFRAGLTGPAALDLLARHGNVLIFRLPVGVGKTHWIVEIARHVLTENTHDLVLILTPRLDILKEIKARMSRRPRPTVLSPRPRRRCGTLDLLWRQLESTGCGALGRVELCDNCPRATRCKWPSQYSQGVKGKRLILATQQHLTLDPNFVQRIARSAGASRVLVLVDESDVLTRPAIRQITPEHLAAFIHVQEDIFQAAGPTHPGQEVWLTASRQFVEAGTGDLRRGGWSLPTFGDDWAVTVQRRGRELYGDGFRFLGYEFRLFSRSDPHTRERLPDGGLRFTATPDLGGQAIIFSGSITPILARFRLNPGFEGDLVPSPFESCRFEHPGTKWLNIRSLEGAARYFPGNASRILDFFAALICRNIRDGKRTLLIARKRFLDSCKNGLEQRFSLMSQRARVVIGNWGRYDLKNPSVLPLINFGVSGINQFEHFDAAYCLTGYYTNTLAIVDAMNDLLGTDEHHPIRIETVGTPSRRQVRVEPWDDRLLITQRIAEELLVQREADVIVQAVGRVRPFTSPREVVTFHAGELPGVAYSVDFERLQEARTYFETPTRRQATQQVKRERILELKRAGKTNQEIASTVGVSVSTVKRYAARGGGST